MRNYRLLILILVIVAIAIWIVLPNNPGIHLGSLQKEIKTRLGLDLVGGVQALLEADLPAGTPVDATNMQTATTIVENRVNGLGVTEALVQQAGDRRIVVELPGVSDPEEAIKTIQETGLLEFVDMGDNPLPEGQIVVTDFGQTTGPQATPAQTPGSVVTPDQTPGAEGSLSPTPATETVLHTVMTGSALESAQVVRSTTGEYEVQFTLTPDGAKTFADFTSNNIGKFLGIVLDKKVISAPVVRSAITEGQGVIQGNFDPQSANALAIQLRYGSLPIPLKIVSSQLVGPTLGEDSLRKSLIAGVIGLAVVILFMILYYRLPGLLASVALLIYAVIVFAIYKFYPVTLTLPGIAGFILSIGVAVDANVLIFERLKEELRGGRNLHQAIDIGWNRAWPSIRDSNISTLITCVILFWFGSTFGASIVKGFSLTLFFGVLVSMFTAIVVTRTLLHLVLDNVEFTSHHSWFGV